jgi:urea transporter
MGAGMKEDRETLERARWRRGGGYPCILLFLAVVLSGLLIWIGLLLVNAPAALDTAGAAQAQPTSDS